MDEAIFLKVIEDYPELKDRFIVEMKDFEQHIRLSNKAFKNIILNIVDTQYTREEILDFLNRHNLYGGVIMEKKTIQSPPIIQGFEKIRHKHIQSGTVGTVLPVLETQYKLEDFYVTNYTFNSKNVLFMYITKVKYNRFIIFSISTLIILFFFTWIYFSRNKKKNKLGPLLFIIQYRDLCLPMPCITPISMLYPL